jgi:hypothetical protein
MGVTCGCVREPGSLTLPILVGFVVFSTSSKTRLCPFLAVQQQNPGVTHIRDRLLAGGFAANPFRTLMVNLYGPWERRRLACPRQGFGEPPAPGRGLASRLPQAGVWHRQTPTL